MNYPIRRNKIATFSHFEHNRTEDLKNYLPTICFNKQTIVRPQSFIVPLGQSIRPAQWCALPSGFNVISCNSERELSENELCTATGNGCLDPPSAGFGQLDKSLLNTSFCFKYFTFDELLPAFTRRMVSFIPYDVRRVTKCIVRVLRDAKVRFW